ncbi:unnamed protein product [Meganyctiphanes norvegica]|uniref:Uncharacterized protein n=1 Tax=Meganyctiphanes norvegica TaxID=48144 RepID=A0AAV2QQV4_MEGNR
MKWFYCSGIFLLFFLNVNAGQQDCLVDDVYKKQHWSGEEVIFFTYVSEIDVVNIKITYKFLEDTDYFTTFYFSPSEKYSKIIETKYGEELHQFPLKTMNKKNEWVEFKISSDHGTIEVLYGTDTHEQISINQTSHTFKDIIIRASNISFCENDREWEVSEEKHQIIPLGKDVPDKSFHLKLYPQHDSFKHVISICNSNRTLIASEYNLMMENTTITLNSLKDSWEPIEFNVTKNVTTIDIFSPLGSFVISVSFKTKSPPSAITLFDSNTGEDECPYCNNLAYIIGCSPFVIFSIFIIVVGVTAKFDILACSSNLINSMLKNKQTKDIENAGQESRNELQKSKKDDRKDADTGNAEQELNLLHGPSSS